MKSGRIGSRTYQTDTNLIKSCKGSNKPHNKPCFIYFVVCSTDMKNILSIMVFITGLIAIPIQIVMIYEGNQRLLYIILMCLTVPGFIISIRHLMNKVHFKVDFRIDD